MNKYIVIGVLLPLLAVTLIGCSVTDKLSQKAGEELMEKTIEKQTGAKVDINSNGEDITIKSADGQTQYSSGGSAQIPEGFPKELIVADDAKIIMSSSSKTGSSVSYVTNSAQTDISAKLLTTLGALGWEKQMDINSDNSIMLTYAKGSMSAIISIGENDSKEQSGKTFVNVTYVTE